MPDPKNYKDKQEFISECIRQNIKEGKTQNEASGKCYGMWENAKKSEINDNMKELRKSLLELRDNDK